MTMKRSVSLSILIQCFTCVLQAQRDLGYRAWQQVVYDRPESWYGSEEALRIAGNVLLYEREVRGWPKNTPMHLPLSEAEKQELRVVLNRYPKWKIKHQ
jgi:pectinesterase